MQKVSKFFKSLLSADEKKASIVVWIMIITFGFGMYSTYQQGDFPPNLLTLVQFLVGSVMTYNIATAFSPTNKDSDEQ